MRRAVFLVLVVVAAGAGRGQTVACPNTITVTESAETGGGWKSTSAKAERRFERVSIYNGKQGGEMNLFLRCRYRGASVTLDMDLAAPLQTCTFTFELQKDGAIGGKPAAVCR
jgi:hypothetical protein